jgi:hypothetical protein
MSGAGTLCMCFPFDYIDFLAHLKFWRICYSFLVLFDISTTATTIVTITDVINCVHQVPSYRRRFDRGQAKQQDLKVCKYRQFAPINLMFCLLPCTSDKQA